MRTFKYCLFVFTIFLISSCLFITEKKDKTKHEAAIARVEFNEDGLYLAKFSTLNPQVNGTIPGSLTFSLDGDKLLTFVRLFAGKPSTWHQQGIYKGKRCPSLEDDLNLDGFIDIEEAMSVTGGMMIPIDGNLDSQEAGANFYPISDSSGYYHYERVASLKRIQKDLKDEDLDQTDHIVKLNPNEELILAGRVVLILGVSEDTLLPDTIVGLGKRKPYQVFPITCGIIQKLSASPGSPNGDVIPGPVAEIEEGQDHPDSTYDDLWPHPIPFPEEEDDEDTTTPDPEEDVRPEET